MSISRRRFIQGTAAGLLLTSYYDKVLAYFENTGEVLLEVSQELLNDPWIKVVGMLQQNWAVVVPEHGRAEIVFFNDDSRVFDEMSFQSKEDAENGLRRNGFRKYSEEAVDFIPRPDGAVVRTIPLSQGVYSSGEYWVSI